MKLALRQTTFSLRYRYIGWVFSYLVLLLFIAGQIVLPQPACALPLKASHASDSLKEKGFIVPDRFISTVWQTDKGLPHHSVLSLLQTQDGYLWLATHEGVVRFDGVRFTVFDKHNTPAIKENSIERFWEDSRGRLWGETIERNPFYYDNGVFYGVNTGKESTVDRIIMTFFDNNDTLWFSKKSGIYTTTAAGRVRKIYIPSHVLCDSIACFAQDSSGRIWLAGKGTLAYYDRGNMNAVALPKELGKMPIKTMLVSRSNTLWFICGTSIVSYREGQWHIYAFSPTDSQMNSPTRNIGHLPPYMSNFPSEPRRLLFHDSEGRVWVRTLDGMYYFHEQIGWQPLTIAQGLLGSDVYLMKEAPNGALWLGLHNRGIQIWHNNSLQTITKENGNLLENSIRALWLGREGEYWVGTLNSGLNRLRTGTVQMLDKRSGLPEEKVFCMMQSRDGALLVGTASTGLVRLSGDSIQTFTKKDGLGENIVRTLFEDKAGYIWVGTSGGGVQQFDIRKKRVLEQYTDKNGLLHNNIFTIHQDKQGAMWFGTERGLACRRPDNRQPGTKVLKLYSTENGLSFDRIRCFAEDSTGALWVGTGRGVNKIINGVITASYTAANGFPGNNRVFALYADKDTALWLGTFNSGLFRFKNGVFKQFSQAQGMMEDVVYGIAEDSNGYLWLSGNKGISRVSKQVLNDIADGKAGRIPIKVESFTKADGMNDNECNGGSTPSIYTLRTGHIAFPTMGGVVLLKPGEIRKNALPPTIHIEEVLSDTVKLSPTEETIKGSVLRVAHTVQNFEFHYTAISMLVPERVKFKYLLEGYDKSWISAGTRRVAYYTNLPPGQYRFRVIACNNDGVWNMEGAVLSFRILPPWWATWWAWGLYGASFLAFSFVALRYRDRRQRKRLLEKQREREAEIVRKKNAELEQANSELRLLNEEKNEFLGIAAHDLKNPLGVINSFAELLVLDDANISIDERGSYLQTIISSSERMIDLISNLLDVNAIERGGIALHPVNIDIVPVIEALIDTYQSRAEQKNIRLTLEVECRTHCKIIADERAIIQVFDNLISNAVKYSPRGKNVYVRVKNHSMTNDVLRVEIQDEGSGISPEDMKRLFGKFARLTARPTGGEHSTGLGLSIVKKMVEAMNGKVWCESELGKGAMFVVELPAA